MFGGLAHDGGAIGRSAEAGGDVNVEVRFDELASGVWDTLLNPRPHVGLSLNSAGNTSLAYLGKTWLFGLGGGLFGGGRLGGAVHKGEPETAERDRKSRRSSVFFRESIEVGYRFAKRHSLSVVLALASNAGLANRNQGLDNAGFRYALQL